MPISDSMHAMQALDTIAEKIRRSWEAKNAARDAALGASRELVRHCSLAIRATHRAELTQAAQLLGRSRELAAEIKEKVADNPDLYFTGYVQDALKELAEAHIVHALVGGADIPDPDTLGVDYASYLNGLGEAAGEMRRYVLDTLRRDSSSRGEEVLDQMEEIYSVLATMDFPDALTGGLRRTTDMVRGVLERTRADLTTAARQEKLQATLREFEAHLKR